MILPVLALLYIKLWASMNGATLPQLHCRVLKIMGFSRLESKWERAVLVKSVIKLSLYSSLRVLRVVEISWIRLAKREARFKLVLKPERRPKRIHFPSMSSS